MKHIPNLITISRIFMSILLLFTIDSQIVFTCIFLYCGFSDIIDGLLARKLKVNSRLGARLDSLADVLLFVIVMICMVVYLGEKLNHFYGILLLIAGLRLFNLFYAAIKYHCFLQLHTLGNKAAGAAVYIGIFIYRLSNWDGIIYIVAAIGLLSAIEELLIHRSAKQPDPDRKGLFW